MTRITALAAALAFLGCATAGSAPAPGTGHPLLWRAHAPEGGVLYLFGSVHMAREDLALGRAVDAAYEASEELVVEVDVSQVDPVEAASVMLRYAVLPAGESLQTRLSEDTYAELSEYLAARGATAAAVDHLEPWFVATTVMTLELAGAGYETEHGVDLALIAQAEGALPVVGLETFEGQIQMFDGLPPETQEMMLRDSLLKSGSVEEGEGNEGLLDAWQRGDEERLAQLLFAPQREHPELAPFYDAVFFDRNRRMADRLVELNRDGKTRFVVVGAGHLVGPRGIPRLLRARGFQVERIYEPPAVRARSRSKNCSSSACEPAAMPASMSVFSWL